MIDSPAVVNGEVVQEASFAVAGPACNKACCAGQAATDRQAQLPVRSAECLACSLLVHHLQHGCWALQCNAGVQRASADTDWSLRTLWSSKRCPQGPFAKSALKLRCSEVLRESAFQRYTIL